jgi:endo-1,4-beta-xylanase
VFVNGLNDVYYVNTKDGRYPLENVIVNELIPYIDANFRTLAKRECRAVAGYSMGGYGAAHLGYKYPEVFGVVSSSSGLTLSWDTLQKLPMGARILPLMFGSDRAYWDENDPVNLVRRNAEVLRCCSHILTTIGSGEIFNINGTVLNGPEATKKFHELLDSLSIPDQFIVEPGGHGAEFFQKASDAPFLFFGESFRDCAP